MELLADGWKIWPAIDSVKNFIALKIDWDQTFIIFNKIWFANYYILPYGKLKYENYEVKDQLCYIAIITERKLKKKSIVQQLKMKKILSSNSTYDSGFYMLCAWKTLHWCFVR